MHDKGKIFFESVCSLLEQDFKKTLEHLKILKKLLNYVHNISTCNFDFEGYFYFLCESELQFILTLLCIFISF